MKNALRILLALAALLVVGLAIFWFARPYDVEFEAMRPQVPHAELSRFVQIDGLRVHYQEAGTGAPLVLVHGFMASTFVWKDVLPALADRFRVVAVDLKGFGFTEKPASGYALEAQADLVVRLLDRLGIDRAAFCGNSMGGAVALHAAIRHPRRVSALVLVDSAGLRMASQQATPVYARWPVVGPLLGALAVSFDGPVRAGLQACYFDPTKVTEADVSTCRRVLATRAGLRAAVAVAREPFYLGERAIAGIAQPTLILWGAQDRLIPVEAGKRFNALVPGSRFVVLERCGHMPPPEMPDRFVREVSGFLLSLQR